MLRINLKSTNTRQFSTQKSVDKFLQAKTKTEIYWKKIMLCTWRYRIHLDFLKHNGTLIAHSYAQWLQRVNQYIIQKRPMPVNRKEMLFSMSPQTAYTKNTTEKDFWTQYVLPYSPYSFEILSTDCYPFRLLQLFMGNIFSNVKIDTRILRKRFYILLKTKRCLISKNRSIQIRVNMWLEKI